jgi:transcriptional regulator with XRE-family HTH domain
MSVRDIFAHNLQRLCRTEDSIAAVCRGTGINRQQFNRYRTGRALPQDDNLDKICDYFAVPPEELFRGAGAQHAAAVTGAGSELMGEAARLVAECGQASLAPGIYFAHFAYPPDPQSVVRSAVVITHEENRTTFRRVTGLAEGNGSWWSRFRGDHRGFVIERRHGIYFAGINVLANLEPTLLVLRWIPFSEPVLGGHALILTPQGPTPTAVVLTAADPDLGFRAAVEASHAVSINDPSIDPVVLDTLDQQCQQLVAQVRPLDLGVSPQFQGTFAG